MIEGVSVRPSLKPTNLGQTVKVVDFRQEHASDRLVPESPIFSNSAWENFYLELHEQPKFDTGEHQQTMHVIAHVLSFSVGERWLDGKCQRENRRVGNFAICPEGVSHRCNWNTSTRFMILAIEPVFLERIGQDCINPNRIELIPQFATAQDSLIHGILSTLGEELQSGRTEDSLLIDSLKTALAIRLLQKYCTIQPKPLIYNGGLPRAKLQQLTEYIDEFLHQDLQLRELAAIVQLSQYHFSRAFKQSTGLSPHQYVIRQRVERAKLLLKQGKANINDIAVACGFSHQSHLNRHFKRLTGITPKTFLKS